MVRVEHSYLMLFLAGLFLMLSCDEGQVEGKSTDTVDSYIEVDTANNYGLTDEYDTTSSFEELVATYERPDRSDWQKPNEVIEFLGDELDNKVVAEIGAGSGYFTFRLVPRVEKIIAIDIDPRMLEFIDSCTHIYLPEDLQDNIETRLASADDPNLSPGEVDIVFLANTYAFIHDRVDYFSSLKRTIRPGGRLVIVDYKKRHLPVGPEQKYKVPLYQVEQELLEAGYTQVYAEDQILPYQYIVVALLN